MTYKTCRHRHDRRSTFSCYRYFKWNEKQVCSLFVSQTSNNTETKNE